MVANQELVRGRECYGRRRWQDAFEAFSAAQGSAALDAEDLELLARSAYMLGRDDDYVRALDAAHRGYLARDANAPAARCAFWIGHNLMFRGESAPAAGWFARAERLVDRAGRDCVERGYLLIPEALRQGSVGDFEAVHATATEMAVIADRFGDPDLAAIALMEQGHSLVRQGRPAAGLRLVDESMVCCTTGELSPIVAGILYCNTIDFCQRVYELRRARDWTVALTRWCDQQPDMIAHRGLCLVHRAAVLTRRGAWRDAMQELIDLGGRNTDGALNQLSLGEAAYQQAELFRLQGDYAAAEASYRAASNRGREPQPGMALLRLAQGGRDAAAAAIRRAVTERSQPLNRAALLPAYVEIMLAAGDLEAARAACRELDDSAERQGSEALRAMSAHALGAVALAQGDAGGALQPLRQAWRAWQDLDVPYESARVRVLLAEACARLGDDDSAALEREAARSAFAALGARPDLSSVDPRSRRTTEAQTYGLSPREREVLRLIASGKSNHEIAEALVISAHTVARHVQNIFAKLGVSSRTAAGAFAFEHDLA